MLAIPALFSVLLGAHVTLRLRLAGLGRGGSHTGTGTFFWRAACRASLHVALHHRTAWLRA